MTFRMLVGSSLIVLAACVGTPGERVPSRHDADPSVVPTPAPKNASSPVEDGDLAKLRKELPAKQRELSYAEAEAETAAMGARIAAMGAEVAKRRAAAELDEARRELEAFVGEIKPRELEERRIRLDGSIHRADHAKDELGELTAMYEADEFAKATKELVLKRGRRELEMAERSLAVARAELAHFERVDLPKRQRELERKVADAEHEVAKQAAEDEKRRREEELGVRKAQDRMAELKAEIAELATKLAAAEKGAK
jgi:hypothetical protein